MADRWGIAHSYTDVGGRRRSIRLGTVDRLREVIGEPSGASGPIVLRLGEPLDAPGADVVLEDGAERRVAGPVTDLPLGYHHLIERGDARSVIVAPPHCRRPGADRSWGWAAQVSATRSERSWGFGDLRDLATLGAWAKDVGAGYVLTNPMGVAPRRPAIEASPYSPSSRRFLDPLYLCIDDVPGAERIADRLAPVAAAGRSLNRIREIDRDSVWHHKSTALELIWDHVGPGAAFERWFAAVPADVRRFATWTSLAEQHGPQWRSWSTAVRRPDGVGVERAAVELADRVRFHAWLQWLLRRQFDAAARTVPLVGALTIGVDRDGFDAWEWQDVLALDVSVGAPPDELSAHGQDWGLPPFVPWKLRDADYRPFIETIRSALRCAGGLRIDHVMGLFRLWWVPSGASAADGAFVENRADDLLAILALESHRAGAVVVGEDLGTVLPAARRTLAVHEVLSYRLLWFEDDPPAQWPGRAMAAVTTHDLPTVAGLWDGSDVASQRERGEDPNEVSFSAMRDRLASPADLPDDASPDEAVRAAYRLLADAPSAMVTATLDDAVAETERPNVPGADGRRPNWSLALPLSIEAIRRHPLALDVASILSARTGTASVDPSAAPGDPTEMGAAGGLDAVTPGSATR